LQRPIVTGGNTENRYEKRKQEEKIDLNVIIMKILTLSGDKPGFIKDYI
jgi:hypothetical protein